MPNNQSLQILRGTNDINGKLNSISLLDGQLFYDKHTKTLKIGLFQGEGIPINIGNAPAVLPTASSAIPGIIKLGYAQNNQNYPVNVDRGRAYVSVPWQNDNTTYTLGYELSSPTSSTIKLTPSSGNPSSLNLNVSNGLKFEEGSGSITLTGTYSAGNGLNLINDKFNVAAVEGGGIGVTADGVSVKAGPGILVGKATVGEVTVDGVTLKLATKNEQGGIKTGYEPDPSSITEVNNYAVALKSTGEAYVKVPWTDKNAECKNSNTKGIFPILTRNIYSDFTPGLTSDLDTLDSDGTSSYLGPLYYDSFCSIDHNTGIITAKSFNNFSDARLKENFEEFVYKKSILDLPIYKFDFIKGLKNQIGCKAQDLQEICPEIVNEGNGGYLNIQESKIVYLLIEEIKSLKEEVNNLREYIK